MSKESTRFPQPFHRIADHKADGGYPAYTITAHLNEAILNLPNYISKLPSQVRLWRADRRVKQRKKSSNRSDSAMQTYATSEYSTALEKSGITWKVALAGAMDDLRDYYASDTIKNHPNLVRALSAFGLLVGSFGATQVFGSDMSTMGQIAVTLGVPAIFGIVDRISTVISAISREQGGPDFGSVDSMNRTQHAIHGGKPFFLEYAAVNAVKRHETRELNEWLAGTVDTRETAGSAEGFTHEQRYLYGKALSSPETLIRLCGTYLYNDPTVSQAVALMRDSSSSETQRLLATFDKLVTKHLQRGADDKYYRDRDYRIVLGDLRAIEIPQILFSLQSQGLLSQRAMRADTSVWKPIENMFRNKSNHAVLNAVLTAEAKESHIGVLMRDLELVFQKTDIPLGGQQPLGSDPKYDLGMRSYQQIIDILDRTWTQDQARALRLHANICTRLNATIRASTAWKQFDVSPYPIQKILEDLHKWEVKRKMALSGSTTDKLAQKERAHDEIQPSIGLRLGQEMRYEWYKRMAEIFGPIAKGGADPIVIDHHLGYIVSGLDKRRDMNLPDKKLDPLEVAALNGFVAHFIHEASQMQWDLLTRLTFEEMAVRKQSLMQSLVSQMTAEVKTFDPTDISIYRLGKAIGLRNWLITHFSAYLDSNHISAMNNMVPPSTAQNVHAVGLDEISTTAVAKYGD